MSAFTESVVEQAALAWFEALGYAITAGPEIAPGEPGEERRTYADVVLEGRLRDALARLNPTVSREGLDEAFRKLSEREASRTMCSSARTTFAWSARSSRSSRCRPTSAPASTCGCPARARSRSRFAAHRRAARHRRRGSHHGSHHGSRSANRWRPIVRGTRWEPWWRAFERRYVDLSESEELASRSA